MAYSLHQTVWIPLQDGKRLAATIWMPDGDGPFPAVLEYLPYRRGDGTAPRDDSTYPHFAENRIVGVRVDSRGQGDSDGLFDDEYSPTELSDACEVIAWIAAQEWSNGGVGMMGISWGGFNGLQGAALRPPALKASRPTGAPAPAAPVGRTPTISPIAIGSNPRLTPRPRSA